MTTASTYLGRDPDYVKRNLGTLPAETELYYDARQEAQRRTPPKDIWQDIFAKYLALADPAAALAQWDRWGSVELGDTRTHTLHWMLSLKEMGTPDFSVTADTPLYSVFKRADGSSTYLAFNAAQGADQRALQRRQDARRGAGHAGQLELTPHSGGSA